MAALARGLVRLGELVAPARDAVRARAHRHRLQDPYPAVRPHKLCSLLYQLG